MNRRALLAAPMLLALPARASLGYDISELRLAAFDPKTPAAALQQRTAIPTRALPLAAAALVDALDAGHLEAAIVDPATLAMARARMGTRLTVVAPHIVTRTALPAALKADIAAALA